MIGGKEMVRKRLAYLIVASVLLSVCAMGVSAEGDEVYLESTSSIVQLGETVDVEVWVSATGFQGGQINLTYNSSCVNITGFVNDTEFPLWYWNSKTDGEEWILFAANNTSSTPIPLTGDYKIGTLTIEGVSPGTTTLGFGDNSSIFDDYRNETAVEWVGVSVEVNTSAPTASIEPNTQEVMAGKNFIFNVFFDPGAHGLVGGSVTIEFNTSVIEVNSVAEGDLFSSYFIPQGYPRIDNTNGSIEFDAVSTGSISPPAPAGNYAVINATIKADAPSGEYDLNLAKAEFGNDSGDPITGINIENGTVTVKKYPRWDVTEDGKVDIWDLMKVAAHYREVYTEEPYPRWDVTEDGKVDIWDLMKVAAHYRETYE